MIKSSKAAVVAVSPKRLGQLLGLRHSTTYEVARRLNAVRVGARSLTIPISEIRKAVGGALADAIVEALVAEAGGHPAAAQPITTAALKGVRALLAGAGSRGDVPRLALPPRTPRTEDAPAHVIAGVLRPEGKS